MRRWCKDSVLSALTSPRLLVSKFLGQIIMAFIWVASPTPYAHAATPNSTTSVASPVTDTSRVGPWVYQVTLAGDMVNPGTADYLVRAIERAENEDAEAIIVRIDTPGGLLQSARQIVQKMLNANVPVLTYVFPGGGQAGSAGVFITMAGHIAAMAPGTNIGAAHPVSGQGEDIEKGGGKELAKKIENDTRAFVESIAAERGRNAAWAAKAVTESVSVTAREALKLRVVDLLADSTQDLLEKVHGRTVRLGKREVALQTKGARVVDLGMSAKQKLINLLANPNIAYLLMTIGFLGIYFELSHPGAIFPGIIGGLSLILAFVSLQVLPFNAGGLALIGLAVALFIAELFVTSFGLLTVGGLVSLVLGSLLLFETPEATIAIDRTLIATVAAVIGASVALVGYLVAKTFRHKPETGAESMVGEEGVATTDLLPEGTVFVHGELWQASSATPVRKGEKVRVTRVQGLRIVVEPMQSNS